jgi:thiol:disulfide interchange protein DsbD
VLALWAIWLIIPAVYLNALDPLPSHASGWTRFAKGLGLIMLVYGILLLVGSAMGGKDVLQPLSALAAREGGGASPQAAAHLNFIRVKTEADFNRELAAAATRGQPVMLDFYADWCISCKEMERYTFAEHEVQQALGRFTLLQADVTANSSDDQALMKRFGLFGPPSILFFDPKGQEQRALRIVGFKEAAAFIALVKQVP